MLFRGSFQAWPLSGLYSPYTSQVLTHVCPEKLLLSSPQNLCSGALCSNCPWGFETPFLPSRGIAVRGSPCCLSWGVLPRKNGPEYWSYFISLLLPEWGMNKDRLYDILGEFSFLFGPLHHGPVTSSAGCLCISSGAVIFETEVCKSSLQQ